MANNKNLLIKNPIETNGNIDVTVGTVSGATLDLSTGNYFQHTMTAATTYVFSNPGDGQMFHLEITGGGDYAITWPSTVYWSSGAVPYAPNDLDQDIWTFITRDGGTSYLGVRSVNAFAATA
jgi:hypothetical protein